MPPLHLAGAWAGAAHQVLGQQRVDDHSNEITTIPELLEMLVLEGYKESGTAEPESLPAVARPGRGLNLPEIRRLLWRLWLWVPASARAILAWSHWHRRHQ